MLTEKVRPRREEGGWEKGEGRRESKGGREGRRESKGGREGRRESKGGKEGRREREGEIEGCALQSAE